MEEKKDSLAITARTEIVPDAKNMQLLATNLLQSGMFPQIRNVAGVVTVIEYGRELGIPPVASLQTFAIVKGKLCMEAKVMLALANSKGVRTKILKKTREVSQVQFSRESYEPHTENFTIKDAEALGFLSKDNWKNYPEEMCYWRCIAKGLRAFAPDVILGLYSKEEVYDFPDKKEIDEEITEEQKQPLKPEEMISPVIEDALKPATDEQKSILNRLMAILIDKYNKTPFELIEDITGKVLKYYGRKVVQIPTDLAIAEAKSTIKYLEEKIVIEEEKTKKKPGRPPKAKEAEVEQEKTKEEEPHLF